MLTLAHGHRKAIVDETMEKVSSEIPPGMRMAISHEQCERIIYAAISLRESGVGSSNEYYSWDYMQGALTGADAYESRSLKRYLGLNLDLRPPSRMEVQKMKISLGLNPSF